MSQELDRDINGMIFASWFDEDMNDGAEAYSMQSPRSSVLAFADKDRIEKFVKQNSDDYKIVRTSGNTIIVDSLDDGMRLTISPLKTEQIKDRTLKSVIGSIDTGEDSAGVVEIKAMPIKECMEIVEAISIGDMVAAAKILESLVDELVQEKIEMAECLHEGLDEVDYLMEKFRIKVNFRGKRIRRIICRKGFKIGPNKRSCVRIGAAERLHRRIGMRHALRTKKGKGAALRRKTNIKRKRALKKRHSMGL